VKAFALWNGWYGYDRKKYKAMLREAFEPFTKPCGGQLFLSTQPGGHCIIFGTY